MNISRRVFLRIVAAVEGVLVLGLQSQPPKTRAIFADDGMPVGDNSGSSWANACTLAEAIERQQSSGGAMIYVRAQLPSTS